MLSGPDTVSELLIQVSGPDTVSVIIDTVSEKVYQDQYLSDLLIHVSVSVFIRFSDPCISISIYPFLYNLNKIH